MNAKKEECWQNICCTDNGTENLLAEKEGASNIFDSKRPEMGVSHPSGSGGGDGSNVSGRPDSPGKTIQDVLEEKCPDFNCTSVDEEALTT